MRRAAARDRRWRPGDARRHALARGRQALQRRGCCSTAARSRRCASSTTCPITACSTRSASSPPARRPGPIAFRGVRLGVRSARTSGRPTSTETPARNRRRDSARPQRLALRERQGRRAPRRSPCARVKETGLPLIYLNQVGGQDELVFDGASFVLNADVRAAAPLPGWQRGAGRSRDWQRARTAAGRVAPGRSTPPREAARRRSITP